MQLKKDRLSEHCVKFYDATALGYVTYQPASDETPWLATVTLGLVPSQRFAEKAAAEEYLMRLLEGSRA